MNPSKRILKIMTSNLTLFPGKTKATGIFYTVIMVPHDIMQNRSTIDITNFDIIWSNVMRYANTMYENYKAPRYWNHPLKCILTLEKFPNLVPRPFVSDLHNVEIPQITAESFNVSCFLETKCIDSTWFWICQKAEPSLLTIPCSITFNNFHNCL